MTSAAHIAVGAAICSRVRQPWLGLPAAFASHFLLDAWPHFEQAGVVGEGIGWPHAGLALRGVNWAATAAIVGLLAWRLRSDSRWRWLYVVGGGLLAYSPDWLKLIGGPTSWFATFHSGLHAQTSWANALHRYFTDRSLPVTHGYPAEVLIRSGWAWTGWLLMVAWEATLTVGAAWVALVRPPRPGQQEPTPGPALQVEDVGDALR